MTYFSVILASILIGYEGVPHLDSSLVGHVEGSILQEKGQELEMDLHILEIHTYTLVMLNQQFPHSSIGATRES